MLLNGTLGENDKPKLTQEEYDVTAYRNVLDRIQTIEGELKKLRGYLRGELAISINMGGRTGDYAKRKKLSGWAMQKWGGKDPYRWSKVVSKKIGLNTRNYNRQNFYNQRMDWAKARAGEKWKNYNGTCQEKGRRGGSSKHNRMDIVCKERAYIGAYTHRISSHVFDIHNLIRNVNMELNRLRIEMPFDLRQLTNQLNLWAGGLTAKRDADLLIQVYKIFEKTEELRKNIIPKMRKRLEKKIKEAKLAEKVAADEMRKENEKTITKEEREEQEKEKQKKQEQKQETSDNQVPRGGGGSGTPAKIEALLRERDQAERDKLRETIEENEKLLRELSKQNGDGQMDTMLPLGALALLVMLGQG